MTGRPPSGERGFSSSLEWAMLMPVVLALVFIIIQVGLMAHGRTVAFNAAAAAAEEASVVRASPAAGTAVGTVGRDPGHCAPRTCVHWGVRAGDTYVDPLDLLAGFGPVVLLPG